MGDVQFLQKYAIEESFLFVVDSSKRDTRVYPEAHEYQVEFNAPFRDVIGLDLIDATVPRTEYTIENNSNTLRYTYAGEPNVATVPPGDYHVVQLVTALNAALVPNVRVSTATVPAEISNKVMFVSDAPLSIHAADSGLRKALGLGVGHVLTSETQAGAQGTRTVLQGPVPALSTVGVLVPARQSFVAPASGSLEHVRVFVSSSGAAVVRCAVVTSQNELVGHGSLTTTGVDFERIVIPVTGKVVAGTSYYVVLQGDATVSTGGEPVSTAIGVPGSEWWSFLNWTAHNGALCVDVSMSVDGHVLRPPGVVDLTGEPYVLVRCPEIERELFRDRAFERVHTGLGLVKLGNYGFREQRYDFNSFPSRRLPVPIGKLSKLTIRLEKGNGELYDTKGIDHFLVFVVKYMEVTQATQAMMRSVQNPAYEPHPQKYMSQNQNPARWAY